ncbi:MAG: tetratricopeptide repeat protein [Verrucomicrobiota bacterium]
MSKWIAMGLAVGLCNCVLGKDAPALDDAIPAAVKALGAPSPREFPGGIAIAVSAATDEAQAAVIQGLNHLNAGWEFEASRHFAVAMRADPDCLLAHWGMAMALLVPTPPTGKARNAAVERMLDLLDQGLGSDLERGYVYGLVKYLEEGPVSAASAFHKVAKKFPNDMQAAVLAALFGRGGYDETGSATLPQQQAEDELSALVKAHPVSPLPLNALLLIRAEASDLTPSLEAARKLCSMMPNYAPYCHLLGHYEWRCGNHAAATAAFGLASKLFEEWIKANKTTFADCPDWVKAECYRAVALASQGEFDAALTAAKRLADKPLPVARASSAGVRMMLWEATTLPARLLMRRGKPGDAALALAALPKPAAIKPYHDECLAYWGIDGLRVALEMRRLIEEGNLDEARKTAAALTFHGEQMAKAQEAAAQGGERSAWARSFHSIELLANENRGRLALAGPANLRGSAYNWFRAAADRQRPAVLLYTPVVLSPMSGRLGDYYLTENQPDAAIEAFGDALLAFPNDLEAMQGLHRAYEAAKQPDKAAALARKIKLLQQP